MTRSPVVVAELPRLRNHPRLESVCTLFVAIEDTMVVMPQTGDAVLDPAVARQSVVVPFTTPDVVDEVLLSSEVTDSG